MKLLRKGRFGPVFFLLEIYDHVSKGKFGPQSNYSKSIFSESGPNLPFRSNFTRDSGLLQTLSGPKYKIIRSSSPYPKVCTLETVSDGPNCEYLSKMDINQSSRDHHVIDDFKNPYNFPRYANSGRTQCRSPFVDILS